MAEAVGFVLAIAPLVVSAPEHYSTATKVIKRYRLSTLKLEELISKFKAQLSIFRRTIWRLLAYDVGLGQDEASQMLADPQHTGWSNAETRAYFDQRMAGVSDELLESVRRINSQLALLNLNKRSSSPSKLLADGGSQATSLCDIRVDDRGDPHTDNGSIGGSHASRMEKARFATPEDKLRGVVENVCSLTKDFRTLAEQTAPWRGRTAMAKPGSRTCVDFVRKRSTEVDDEKIIYVETQEGPHAQRRGLFFIPKRWISEHALVWLGAQQNASDSVSTTFGPASRLTSRCLSTPPPPYSLEPTGREATPRMIEAAILLNLLSSGLKRKLPDTDVGDELEESRLGHKRLNFGDADGAETMGVVDKCELVDEICEGEAQPMECLGDHECDNPIPSTEPSDGDQTNHPQDPIMPLSERIIIAKRLAAAFLHFHVTPELTPSLGNTLDETHLIIRGGDLYEHLGSLCGKTWDVDTKVPLNTDYDIANRVRFQVADLVGVKYAEVVRKCIQYDFGHGDDLGQTKLREGFHQDVVCKLEELEEAVRGLSFAI